MNTHHEWKARASSGVREHARRSSAISEAKLEKKPLNQNSPQSQDDEPTLTDLRFEEGIATAYD
ncbi:hypothetical protein HID58_012890 [Brassica napus]|uniref:Uncharacterized protein n=1 Tax=Brassica napus TaxID=3708 RepID=A0ABQ8E2B7_BRANA|nr:hypothetical protein HID58_012889 [Brassica napus]KAH0935773.1 hypothetical protein HID58_012890 [Brassica napus]